MAKRVHLTLSILLLFVFSTNERLFAKAVIYCGDPAHLHCVGEFETDDCRLLLLEDCAGRSAIAKMILSDDPEEQALLIIDCCAAAIAQELSLPINRIELLPCRAPWSELPWYEQLAALHQRAPGKSTEEALPWKGFTLQQRFREVGSPQWEKWGPLPEEKKGLSRKVIATMACHPDLARIAALDTFLGNADRGRPNLYYCPESNRFFGIDQAASFRSPLAAAAIAQLQRLAEEGFSENEKGGLQTYLETLEELSSAISPNLVESWLLSSERESRLHGASNRMRAAIGNFSENYSQTLKLVDFLHEILSLLN